MSHKLEMEHVLSEISEKFTGIYQFDIIINESLQMLSEYSQESSNLISIFWIPIQIFLLVIMIIT